MSTIHNIEGEGMTDQSEPYQTAHALNPDEKHSMKDIITYISELFGRLNSEIGNLVSLRMDLLKVEVRDSVKRIVVDSALAIVGAVVGFFAFIAVTLAIIGFIAFGLPIENAFLDFAVASTIVAAAYGILAGILVLAGMANLKKGGLAPERSIAEVKRDKEWVKEEFKK